MKWIESLTGGYRSSAKVVDGTLVLSLPDALTPVVWRMDLGNARSSAAEVREAEEGKFALVLKTQRGETQEIAVFPARPQAVRALLAIARALEQAQGSSPAMAVESPQHPATPVKRGGRKKWLVALAIALLLLAWIFYSSSHIPQNASFPSATTPPAQPSQAGVPLNADDFLRGRQP